MFAGVMMERLRLLGRLDFGGLEGRENEASAGSNVGKVSAVSTAGNEMVEAVRVPSDPVVLTARFLRFLGFFPGVVGL